MGLKYQRLPLCTKIQGKVHVFLDAASCVLLIMWLTKLPLLQGESESLRVGVGRLFTTPFWAFLTLTYIFMKHTLICLGKKCVLFPQARAQLRLSAAIFVVSLDIFLIWIFCCSNYN